MSFAEWLRPYRNDDWHDLRGPATETDDLKLAALFAPARRQADITFRWRQRTSDMPRGPQPTS